MMTEMKGIDNLNQNAWMDTLVDVLGSESIRLNSCWKNLHGGALFFLEDWPVDDILLKVNEGLGNSALLSRKVGSCGQDLQILSFTADSTSQTGHHFYMVTQKTWHLWKYFWRWIWYTMTSFLSSCQRASHIYLLSDVLTLSLIANTWNEPWLLVLESLSLRTHMPMLCQPWG